MLWEGLRGLGQMLREAGRLLVAHWPALLALYLAGAAGRLGFLWLALWISKSSSLLGVLLLPLAPLSMLLAMVFMLRVLARSLRVFAPQVAGDGRDRTWKETFRGATQVLIPFLAVYASQGLLREDITQFIYNATVDESLNNPLTPNYARTLLADGPLLIAIVLLAMALRKWISAHRLTEKTLGWASLGSYLEGLWLITLSASLTSQVGVLRDWVMSRAVVNSAVQLQEAARNAPGVAGQAVTQATGWLSTLLGSMGELIIVPVAWLAIGALVYGHQLSARTWPPLPTHEQVTARLRRIPNPVRQFFAQGVEPVVTPVRNTVTAISKVASAGILPMVLFCVSFALLGQLLRIAVAFLARWVTGPQPALWQAALDPYVALVERGAYLIVTAALVAAAVQRVTQARPEQGPGLDAAPAPAPGSPAESEPATAAPQDRAAVDLEPGGERCIQADADPRTA